MKYYIIYDVPHMKKTGLRAGPYTSDEVGAQKKDIEFYDATNIRVISEDGLQNKTEEGQL